MPGPAFEQYASKYQNVSMRRVDGILELTLHTGGGELVWNRDPFNELPFCFADIGADPENKVIIVTGTGDSFIGHRQPASASPTARDFGQATIRTAVQLNRNLLEIDVPMIAAVNGPTIVHAELALMCDIVLAAENASFQDEDHFLRGLVPGDGAHIIWPMLLGPVRARYFLLTGQTLSAQQALQLGVVNEVLPRPELLPRAWELARFLLARPPLTVRLTRTAITQEMRRQFQSYMGYGMTLEALAGVDEWPP